jgi:hypothetical protein
MPKISGIAGSRMFLQYDNPRNLRKISLDIKLVCGNIRVWKPSNSSQLVGKKRFCH